MSNRTVKYFLITILIYNLFLRSTNFEQHGGDSWSHYLRTTVLLEYGRFTWYLHPLSLYGFFPFSYASGISILLGSLQLTTSIPVYQIIIFSSIFFSLVLNLSLFILCRHFQFSNQISLLALFLCSSTITYLTYTYSVASPRGAIISLAPITAFLLFKSSSYSYFSPKYLFLFLISLNSLCSLHLMFGHFILLIFVPYILWIIYKRQTFYHFGIIKYQYFVFSYILLFAIIISLQYLGITWAKVGVSDYYPIFDNSNIIFGMVNIGASYLHVYGVGVLFLPFGVIFLLTEKTAMSRSFLIVPIFLSSIFIFDTQYFLAFFTFLFAIVAAYGFHKLIKDGNNWFIVLFIITYAPFAHHFFVDSVFLIFTISLIFLFILFLSLVINKRIFFDFRMIAIIILITLYPVNHVVLEGYKQIDNYPDSGDSLVSNHHTNRASWVNEHFSGKVFANSPVLANPICALSNTGRAATYYDITEYPEMSGLLEVDLNVTYLKNYYDASIFENDISDRYNVNLAIEMISRGDFDLAEKHEVGLVVITDESYLADNPDTKEEEVYTNFNIFISEDRYRIYSDIGSDFYHYNTYG